MTMTNNKAAGAFGAVHPGAPGTGPTIRPASVADVEVLVGLNRHVQSIHAAAEPTLFKAEPDPAQIRSAFRALLQKSEILWVLAEMHGVGPAGYILAQKVDRPDAWLRPGIKVCTITQLVVAPAARRRGLARHLVDEVAARAAADGFHRLELDVWSFNAVARSCFTRLGFEVFNERMVRR